MTQLEAHEELAALYDQRFTDEDLESKSVFWNVLAREVFQPHIPQNGGTVLDLGAGNCELINSLKASTRIAVDLNPNTRQFADDAVRVLTTRSDDMSDVADGTVDTVVTSNFFEHLTTKDALLDTLRETKRVLRGSGKLVVLMPNIRYLAGRYWDYFDHHLALTHVSLAEALKLTGYQVETVLPRFLPYTVKDARLPIRPWMVVAYLRLRPLWPLLGRQMLIVASPRPI